MNRYDPPLILQRADPCILLSEDGYYYFTATVPAFDLIELRRARSIEELAAAAGQRWSGAAMRTAP